MEVVVPFRCLYWARPVWVICGLLACGRVLWTRRRGERGPICCRAVHAIYVECVCVMVLRGIKG